MTAQAARINSSVARRGAALIRETAYAALVLDIANGEATGAESAALFAARHRFTPGWSSRGMVAQGVAVIREAVQAAQEGPTFAEYAAGARWPTARGTAE